MRSPLAMFMATDQLLCISLLFYMEQITSFPEKKRKQQFTRLKSKYLIILELSEKSRTTLRINAMTPFETRSVQLSCSIVSDSLNPMDCNMPGVPVHHQLPEPTQTHVYHIADAIQPSHLLSSPSASAFNLSQYQGLFQ